MKIRPAGAEFLHDRRTDMTKLIVAFSAILRTRLEKLKCSRTPLIRG